MMSTDIEVANALCDQFGMSRNDAFRIIKDTKDFEEIGRLLKEGTTEQKAGFLLDRVSAEIFARLSDFHVRPAHSVASVLLGFKSESGDPF